MAGASRRGTFSEICSDQGRPSIPPERLLRALLLQALHGLRSERQMMERLDFDLLFRRFVGLGIDDPVWHPAVYAKNRDRLFAGAVAERFPAAILAHPRVKPLLSRDHFPVDGTLIEARASVKGFQPQAAASRDSHDTGGEAGPARPRRPGMTVGADKGL